MSHHHRLCNSSIRKFTMLTIKKLLAVLSIISVCSAKVVPIFYEDYEFCVTPEENAGKFDFSQMEILAETDTEVYLNGSWNFVKEVKSPWKAKFFLERHDRGEWNVDAIYKDMNDLCESIQGPSEPWYYITSKFEHKNCPFPAGVSFLTLFMYFI